MDFKTTSPQGDGNLASYFSISVISKFQNHIPARGRKPCLVFLHQCHFKISKPHPRKGTETLHNGQYNELPLHFKTTSPQGDGNSAISRTSSGYGFNFKTTSPQGDGNRGNLDTVLQEPRGISKLHPRKGTETFLQKSFYITSAFDFKTTSPQGDGNGLTFQPNEELGELFQNHIPARGRKQRLRQCYWCS